MKMFASLVVRCRGEFRACLLPRQRSIVTTTLLRCAVRLVDENGASLIVESRSEAMRIAAERKLDCKMVAKASEKLSHAVYKLTPLEKPKTPKTKVQPQNKDQMKTKELTMTCLIEQHDLKIKARKLQQFLEKDCLVAITVVKPNRTDVEPKTAFDRLIAELDCQVVVTSSKSAKRFFKATIKRVLPKE